MRTDLETRHAITHLGDRGPTLVLVHGLGCDQRIWSALAPRLATDHRVVLYDLAGTGRSVPGSRGPSRYASIAGWVDDLLEVIASLGAPRPVVIGHSLGANIAVQAAARHPDFAERLVLLMLSPRFLDDPPAYLGGFTEADLAEILATQDQNFVAWARSFSAFVAPQEYATARMTEAIAATDPRVTQQLTELIFRADLRQVLPRAALPTLSVQCEGDPIIPHAAGHLVAELLPHAREHWLEVPGHCPHLSHPALVEASIRAYLGSDA